MEDMKPSEISSSKMFGGHNKRYKHFSPTLGCSMTFHIYFPPSPSSSHRFPVLYWLSGLTCTDENFIVKSGAQRLAANEGIALIAPDTSPRGLSIEGEADSWDLGVGAGFYLNATQEKWKNWRMYDYVVKELPKLLNENFSQLDTSRASISGHSMGGHGALTVYLKNLDEYKSEPKFAKYRVKGLKHYSSNQLPPDLDDDRELEENFLNTGVHIDVDLDEDGETTRVDSGRGKRKAITSTPSERHTKKWDKMESYLAQCSEAMSRKLQNRRDSGSEEASSTCTSKELYSIQECIGIVESMGDINDDTFNKFLDKIVFLEWRKVFVTLTDARRRPWLECL